MMKMGITGMKKSLHIHNIKVRLALQKLVKTNQGSFPRKNKKSTFCLACNNLLLLKFRNRHETNPLKVWVVLKRKKKKYWMLRENIKEKSLPPFLKEGRDERYLILIFLINWKKTLNLLSEDSFIKTTGLIKKIIKKIFMLEWEVVKFSKVFCLILTTFFFFFLIN